MSYADINFRFARIDRCAPKSLALLLALTSGHRPWRLDLEYKCPHFYSYNITLIVKGVRQEERDAIRLALLLLAERY